MTTTLVPLGETIANNLAQHAPPTVWCAGTETIDCKFSIRQLHKTQRCMSSYITHIPAQQRKSISFLLSSRRGAEIVVAYRHSLRFKSSFKPIPLCGSFAHYSFSFAQPHRFLASFTFLCCLLSRLDCHWGSGG